MKKLGICLVLFFLFWGTSVVYGQSNSTQRFIGTWIGNNLSISFNSDGTYSAFANGNQRAGNYMNIDSKIFLQHFDGTGWNRSAVYEYRFSSNNSVLVLYQSDSTALWLVKQ